MRSTPLQLQAAVRMDYSQGVYDDSLPYRGVQAMMPGGQPGTGLTRCQRSQGRGTEVGVVLDGVSSTHPLPLCPPSPCLVAEAPAPLVDVEMSEVVMFNGYNRIQTQVRLRGDREEGSNKGIPGKRKGYVERRNSRVERSREIDREGEGGRAAWSGRRGPTWHLPAAQSAHHTVGSVTWHSIITLSPSTPPP